MDILGGLVRLDQRGQLPVPWFNRPGLGLASGSIVHLGLIPSQMGTTVPPEIIVTPLNIDRWSSTMVLTIDFIERSGSLLNILQSISSSFNIALAESVTLHQRKTHRVSLVLESKDPDQGRDYAQRQKMLNAARSLIDTIKNRAEYQGAEFFFVDLDTILSKTRQDWTHPHAPPAFEMQNTTSIDQGLIDYTPIRRRLESNYRNKKDQTYDFDRVVISSDTECRLIRYLFPKKGAFEARITAVDQPNTLVVITEVLHSLGYNILLSRLSRSRPGMYGRSVFVAICEPKSFNEDKYSEQQYISFVSKQIESAFDPTSHAVDPSPGSPVKPQISPALEISLAGPVSLGRSSVQAAQPQNAFRHKGRQDIVVQRELMLYVPSYGRSDRKIIFLSYQKEFQETRDGNHFLTSVIHEIETAGFEVYDGFERPRQLQDRQPADARARMWLADAAIFVALNKDGAGLMSSNQFIEWGYIFGQCKPYEVITMSSYENTIRPFMMPDTSFITLNSMTIADVTNVMSSIRTVLARIRP